MRKLYEIRDDILACVDMETGEIVDPDALDALQMELTEKMEGVALWVKDLRAESEAIKAEIDRLTARKRANERNIEGLKAYLLYGLEGRKLKTPRCSVSYTHSQKVEVDDEEQLIEKLMKTVDGDEYLRFKAPEIRKDALKDAMKEGKTFPGVRLVTSESVVIK